MKFNVRALDGSPGRAATRIGFVTRDGVVATVTCGPVGGMTYESDGVTSVPITDVNLAAEQIGHMMHRYRDHSMVIYAGGGTTARGDELTAADVYPPERQPRVNVES